QAQKRRRKLLLIKKAQTTTTCAVGVSSGPQARDKVNLSTYAFLFSEIVQYSHGRVTSLSQLHEKLSDLGKHAGFRMIDVLCLREKTPKRETRLVNHLLYIQKTLWKTLFYKEADRLEQATASESTFYLFEDDPVVNRFISVPKDQSKYQNAQI
ncbi:Trafficking protein particle complex subunit 5, partial [Geodia barretti]